MTASVNYDDVVVDIKALIFGATEPPPISSSECCIYRVPFDIRKLNEDAYTPKLISIGPFHHNLPRLQNMEPHKLSYCRAFFLRSAPDHETTYDQTVEYIRDVLPRFRRHYSDTIEPSDDEKLVNLILIDACFIIELFIKFHRFFKNDGVVPPGEDGSLISIPRLSTIIRLDLILLENQLPFFLLDHVYNNFLRSSFPKLPSFIELTFEYFDFYNISNLVTSHFVNNKIRHFTDLIRTFHLQHPQEKRAGRSRRSVEEIHLRSVTELVGSGIKLQVDAESKRLLDLRFISGRVLQIPRLEVDGSTEGLLRNMVALEQYLYPEESYITDYVALFNFLLRTKEDVDLLVQKGVLINWLGDSDSVAKLFSSVWKNITQSDFNDEYYKLCKDLNAYYEYHWHKWNTILKRDYYCNTPWKVIGLVTAASVVVFGGVQTVCSVFQLIQYS